MNGNNANNGNLPMNGNQTGGRRNNRRNNTRNNTKRRVQGGTRHNRSNKRNQNTMRHRNGNGGSALATAALPFGLFGLQKLAQKRKVRKLSKNA